MPANSPLTPDEVAFLAAIHASPEDLAPRLVFADWLDEQGRHEDADYHRKWSPHVAKLEAQLEAARRKIDDLEEELGEAQCGC